MKNTLDYDQATDLLDKTYRDERLLDALDALDYAYALALDISPDAEMVPVWTKEEILAMGEE